jgi:hypothetical protein
MQTGKPWAHQIDYCGIAEVIFYLLYKEPLQYSLQNGRWLPKQPSVSKYDTSTFGFPPSPHHEASPTPDSTSSLLVI